MQTPVPSVFLESYQGWNYPQTYLLTNRNRFQTLCQWARTRCKTRLKEWFDSSIGRLYGFNKIETKVIDGHPPLTILSWRGTAFADGLFFRVPQAWRADAQLRSLLQKSFLPLDESTSVTGPAIFCHFTFLVKVNYVYVDEICNSLHFCSHADGFHSNLPRVWKQAHSLQEGKGRKVMGLISKKVAAMLVGISAGLFSNLYTYFFLIVFTVIVISVTWNTVH